MMHISDVASQIRGVTYSKEEATNRPGPGRLPILRANNITDEGLDFTDLVWVPRPRISEQQRLKNGDILIATSSGSIDVVGKAARLAAEFEGSFGAFCKVVRPSPRVHSAYLAHFFRTPTYRAKVSSLAAGANINNLRNEHIDSLELPVPPLAEQQRIAAILDRADGIRRKRQQALRLADEFLRSVFLDLFGDPATNPKKWPEEPFGELVQESKLGLVRSAEEYGWNMPVPYVRMDALAGDGTFITEKVQGTNASIDEAKSYGLRKGDFLFNTRNSRDLVGKVAVFPGPDGAVFNNNLMRIRFRPGVDPYFVACQFSFSRVQWELEARKQGTTSVFAVYWKNLATLPILNPPAALQQRFRAVVEQTHEVKMKMADSGKAAVEMFQALQQRAFRGEL